MAETQLDPATLAPGDRLEDAPRLARLRANALAYWRAYLWHHRDPRTRLLHRIGSWTCLVGFGATAMGAGWMWTPLAIAVGYGFAFAGHFVVERNRPLTLRHPVRAAVCNWVMFFYELFWDVEEDLRVLAFLEPDTLEICDC